MRSLQFILAALLGLVCSPLLIPHCCWRKSSVIEIPLTVFATLALPLLIFRQKSRLKAWLLVAATAVLSASLNWGYTEFLHSDYFPEKLMDKSALERRRRVKR